MSLLLKVLVLTFVFVVNLHICLGVCGQCGSAGIVCLTPNRFSACFNGVPDAVVNTCPTGQVCSDSTAVCAVTSATHVADCPSPPSCFVCSGDNRFACVNATTFAYCFGTTNPSTTLDNCPTGQFCNINAQSPGFCSSDSTVTCAPTATTTPLPTTTATISPTAYCSSINARHGTRYASPFNSNCQMYAYCFVRNATIQGSYYRCSGQTFFNNVTGYCFVPPAGFVCPIIIA